MSLSVDEWLKNTGTSNRKQRIKILCFGSFLGVWAICINNFCLVIVVFMYSIKSAWTNHVLGMEICLLNCSREENQSLPSWGRLLRKYTVKVASQLCFSQKQWGSEGNMLMETWLQLEAKGTLPLGSGGWVELWGGWSLEQGWCSR